MKRETTVLYVAGILLLVYAVLGNYVALPGYIRFLERGGRSEAGNGFDESVLLGAAKTVLWMYSFQLGVLALVIARSLREGLRTTPIVALAAVWLCAWSWPSLPAPGPWFYIVFGALVLVGIVAVLSQPPSGATSGVGRTLFLASLAFFAAASWEVCGLGSTGRMTPSDEAAWPLAQNILVTQSSKLMFEFLFAWSLLLASAVTSRRRHQLAPEARSAGTTSADPFERTQHQPVVADDVAHHHVVEAQRAVLAAASRPRSSALPTSSWSMPGAAIALGEDRADHGFAPPRRSRRRRCRGAAPAAPAGRRARPPRGRSRAGRTSCSRVAFWPLSQPSPSRPARAAAAGTVPAIQSSTGTRGSGLIETPSSVKYRPRKLTRSPASSGRRIAHQLLEPARAARSSQAERLELRRRGRQSRASRRAARSRTRRASRAAPPGAPGGRTARAAPCRSSSRR